MKQTAAMIESTGFVYMQFFEGRKMGQDHSTSTKGPTCLCSTTCFKIGSEERFVVMFHHRDMALDIYSASTTPRPYRGSLLLTALILEHCRHCDVLHRFWQPKPAGDRFPKHWPLLLPIGRTCLAPRLWLWKIIVMRKRHQKFVDIKSEMIFATTVGTSG